MKLELKSQTRLTNRAIFTEIESTILTTELPEIVMTVEEALFETQLIEIEQKAVAHQVRLFRGHIRKLERRLLALFKRRSAIEASITVGVKKIEARQEEERRTKARKKKDVTTWVNGLSQKQIDKLIRDIEKEEVKANGN